MWYSALNRRESGAEERRVVIPLASSRAFCNKTRHDRINIVWVVTLMWRNCKCAACVHVGVEAYRVPGHHELGADGGDGVGLRRVPGDVQQAVAVQISRLLGRLQDVDQSVCHLHGNRRNHHCCQSCQSCQYY